MEMSSVMHNLNWFCKEPSDNNHLERARLNGYWEYSEDKLNETNKPNEPNTQTRYNETNQ